jgi:hypothetical protein
MQWSVLYVFRTTRFTLFNVGTKLSIRYATMRITVKLIRDGRVLKCSTSRTQETTVEKQSVLSYDYEFSKG